MHTQTTDAALIESSLELAATRCGDIGPAVYARVFVDCPSEVPLFRLVDVQQPPHWFGQMLFEVLALLQDSAMHQPYVAYYLQQLQQDHQGFGVRETQTYRTFLCALRDVSASCAASDWTRGQQQAWDRQLERLIHHLAPRCERPSPTSTEGHL